MIETARRKPTSAQKRWFTYGVACLFVPFAGYGLAALVLALLPVNPRFKPDPDGVLIFVRANSVHAEIAVPLVSRVADWRPEFPPADPDRIGAEVYLSFGWGDRSFYLETRTWSDFRIGTAARALLGLSPAAMHVELVAGLQPRPGIAAVRISEPQYRELVAYIRASVVRHPDGRPQIIQGRSFGHGDVFIEAHGRYGPILTCNEWVRRGLAQAGIRAPHWSPFAFPIFLHLANSL